MEPIDISSSDSDLELEYYRESDALPTGESASSNPRVLPSWASGSRNSDVLSRGESTNSNPRTLPSWASGSRNSDVLPRGESTSSNPRTLPSWASGSRGLGAQSQTTALPKRTSTSNGRSSSSDGVRTLDPNGRFSSQQALKRSLPSSKSNDFVENVSSSEIRDIYGKPYYLEPPSLSNGKTYTNSQFNSRNDDDVIMYENGGSRILPPSFNHGKSFSTSHAGEQKDAESDERLIYQAALQDLNQPKLEMNVPDGLLSVTLLRHQKIALAWMLQKETRSLHCLGGILADDQGLGKTISMISLIQMQRALQSNSDSNSISKHSTEALNLDDDDDIGNGALEKVEPSEKSEDVKLKASSSISQISSRRPAAGTLVVCPASIVRQWSRELDEKVADEAKLSVLIYHGGQRTKDPVELAKYDVVVTTYAIVTNEVPKQPLVDEESSDDKNGEIFGLSSDFSVNKKVKKTSDVRKKGKNGKRGIDSSSFDYGCGPLAKVGWFRVILDEAQTIKNHRTQVARACCSLRAKRRWCLSGTPIQNSIDDLYSYFRFLRYDPYAVYKSFYNTIKVPISRNAVHGYKKLQAILRAIMLRRTKGTFIDGEPIIKLPSKTICLKKVEFSPEERSFYAKLEADSRSQFKAYAAAGTLNQNYANILLMLLRLRQACDHPLLVKGFNTDSVEKDSLEMAKSLPRDMLINLLNLLEASLAICCVCNDPPEDAVVTMCGHAFCYQCVSEFLTGDENMCPVPGCKEQLGPDIVFSKSTLRSCLACDLNPGHDPYQYVDHAIVLQSDYISSKIKIALEILESECSVRSPNSEINESMSCNENSAELQTEETKKAIVFTQWTSMLNLVETSLRNSCLQYRRLDGTMTLNSRDKAVKDFNTNPEVTVMLMSLKAGNLGLNMVAACHVIMLDLWWNPTTEDQAIDRAHRIGQTRPVTVSRLTVKDTVEDRILALQEEKRKMVASAFGEDHGGATASRLTVEDLRYLFMV